MARDQPDDMVSNEPQTGACDDRPGNPAWRPGGPSPNPAGRPKGIVDRRGKVAQALRAEGVEVARVVLDAALAGDMQAAGLVLNRITPTLRAQSDMVQFKFDASKSIAQQIEQVLAAVATGEVPPDIGQQIIASIGTLANVRATEELERRIAELEAKTV